MNRRILIFAGSILGVGVLALAWWLASPLFLDNEVDDAFPISSETTTTSIETPDPAESTSTTVGTTTTTPPAPVVLSSGSFRDADSSHLGSGSATIYELEDGSEVLRFEDFEVTNGPDLHVYLVPAANEGDQVTIDGYVDLGELKGNVGNQNYELPDDVDAGSFGSVVIWCEPFGVLFSVASLNA